MPRPVTQFVYRTDGVMFRRDTRISIPAPAVIPRWSVFSSGRTEIPDSTKGRTRPSEIRYFPSKLNCQSNCELVNGPKVSTTIPFENSTGGEITVVDVE